jgi:hypothetical protein
MAICVAISPLNYGYICKLMLISSGLGMWEGSWGGDETWHTPQVSRILAKASLVNSILSSITSITVHITALQH